ncbi:LytR/AlgR family response regulator transcription factor [Winogradskyella jejuensis]|uniref:Two component transcriptional regulator, LytTR family n=1 Tax=Winogradskyella jejuensis TaxID=1089305 RepID=A0A1M5U3A5_9FLAO|nr:LytTR family DNA-binding domain-containing protein [Winogradskyella jejuensis]SHH57341.1 two component transcriptional regulator, LytTR family [Winogradskyella jejuensis]
MTYLIIDDERIAHEIIKGYCDKMPNMQLIKHCYDALEALEYLREQSVDLIFLDINMPKLKGFEFLKTLTTPPKVIVTTAYQEYALEGYTLNVVDYLLKPFSFERFITAIQKVKIENISAKTEAKKTEDNTESIFIYSDKKHIQINSNTILYIEAAGNYVKLVTTTKTHLIREKISEILKKLPTDKFMQVHKSYAVSKQHISIVEGNRIKIEDYSIPIGKSYKEKVKQLLL